MTKLRRPRPSVTQTAPSLWDRINADPGFLAEKRRIQARYGLPLPFDIRLDRDRWLAWLGEDPKVEDTVAGRGRAFLEDLQTLFKKFEIPEAWHADFMAEIAGVYLDEARFPRFNLYQDRDGSWTWECIITPETDLTDPLVLRLIQNGQKQYAGDPPGPGRDKKHPRRADWRPVYEWHKRHPLFTVDEIARKIHHAPQTVRRRFAELEKAGF